MTSSPDAVSDPNLHVKEYLEYYVGFEQPPRYAVMLSGKWGAGKTHQAKKILDELLANGDGAESKRYVLVSLYGLKSPQEIDDAMVAALYPWTNNDGARIAASVGKAILKHAKIELPSLNSSDLVNRMSADVFVFDDLERCRMPVTDAFGYINQLVERDGCKVIVLANQDEIRSSEKDDYRIGKEKLIGKTLEVEPDFGAAFVAFLEGITDKDSKDFLLRLKPEIRILYDQSESKNLRILQQTMWDFERVYRVVGQSHRANHDAMQHLLRLFFVLCFEYKSGALSAHDLQGRTSRSLVDAMRSNEAPSPLRGVGEKYSSLYIYDSILSDEACATILIRGIVDEQTITASLNNSSWFVSENEPSWVTLWRSTERPDASVDAAAKVFLTEFAARHYKKTGEVLHLFGQMLFLADVGVSEIDRAETVTACKAYVDDLKSLDELEAPQEAYLDDVRHGSYGGLGFAQAETKEFRELRAYLSDQRAKAEEDRYAHQAKDLVELMKSDSSAFWSQIAYHRDGSARYANKPVLSQIDPKIFADNMIGLDPLAYREVCLGLSARYDMAKLAEGRELEGERDWAQALKKALLDKAKTLEPFACHRISKNVEWTFGKTLSELQESSTSEQ